ALAVHERRADGDRRVHAGDDVGDRHAGALRAAARRAVGLAGDAHHAAHALDHEVVARAFAIRPGVAEAGDRAVHEPGMRGLKLLVAEPVALQVAELVVLDEDVGFRGERTHELLAFRLREVHRDGLFAAVRGREVGGVPRLASRRVLHPGRAEGARIVADLRALDLDHLGAEVSQVLAGPGRREDTRKVEHAHSGQGPRHAAQSITQPPEGEPRRRNGRYRTARLLCTVRTPLTPAVTRPAREAMSAAGTNPES